tara:strand:- start:3037 stop:3252 length:216 start_codon:yes stop_codon:yes gene_type:complete
MKAKLEFDLEDLDDVMSHLRCVKSLDMALALWKIKDISKNKWGYEFTATQFQSKINEVFEEYDINLEDLIK